MTIRYNTYPQPYVSGLEWHKKVAYTLVGFLIAILSYGAYRAILSHSAHREEVSALENQIDGLEAQLLDLQEYKEEKEQAIQKGADYIRKHNPAIKPAEAAKLARWEVEAGRKEGVPARIMFAISRKESHWKQNAVSPTGPCGIKQVAVSWWAEKLGMTRAQICGNAKLNIEAGAKIIAQHYNDTGSWAVALQRYYGGPDPAVSKDYSRKVMTIALGY